MLAGRIHIFGMATFAATLITMVAATPSLPSSMTSMSCEDVKPRFDFFAAANGVDGLAFPEGHPPFTSEMKSGDFNGWVSCDESGLLEEIELCHSGIPDENGYDEKEAYRFKDALVIMFGGVSPDAIDYASRLAKEAEQKLITSEQRGMFRYGDARQPLGDGYVASVNATVIHGMGHLSVCARIYKGEEGGDS